MTSKTKPSRFRHPWHLPTAAEWPAIARLRHRCWRKIPAILRRRKLQPLPMELRWLRWSLKLWPNLHPSCSFAVPAARHPSAAGKALEMIGSKAAVCGSLSHSQKKKKKASNIKRTKEYLCMEDLRNKYGCLTPKVNLLHRNLYQRAHQVKGWTYEPRPAQGQHFPARSREPT